MIACLESQRNGFGRILIWHGVATKMMRSGVVLCCAIASALRQKLTQVDRESPENVMKLMVIPTRSPENSITGLRSSKHPRYTILTIILVTLDSLFDC